MKKKIILTVLLAVLVVLGVYFLVNAIRNIVIFSNELQTIRDYPYPEEILNSYVRLIITNAFGLLLYTGTILTSVYIICLQWHSKLSLLVKYNVKYNYENYKSNKKESKIKKLKIKKDKIEKELKTLD